MLENEPPLDLYPVDRDQFGELGDSDGEDTEDWRGHEVYLNVYDLSETTGYLNDWLLRPANLALLHCGVEVLGTEWFFAWGETEHSGVWWNEPREHQVHVYKESVFMGKSPMSEREIRMAVFRAKAAWPENSYHPIHKNCVTFAEELLSALGVPEPFPTWVRGAAEAGKLPALNRIANLGWEWAKWYCREEPPTAGTTVVGTVSASQGGGVSAVADSTPNAPATSASNVVAEPTLGDSHEPSRNGAPAAISSTSSQNCGSSCVPQ